MVLLPREGHPQDSYVKGDLVVRLTFDKIPTSEREAWRKAFLGNEKFTSTSSSSVKQPIQNEESCKLPLFFFFFFFFFVFFFFFLLFFPLLHQLTALFLSFILPFFSGCG